jgi:hypothetical protein
MPCTHQIGGQILEVMGELRLHLGFNAVALNNSAQPRARLSKNPGKE